MSVDLGTLIGSLLAEITRARLAADIEATRVANLYGSDPMLSQMPIPRFRLPDVHVTLPIVVENLEGEGAAPPPPRLPSATKRKAMVTSAMKFAGFKLRPAERAAVLKALDDEVGRIEAGPRNALRAGLQARRLGSAVDTVLTKEAASRRKPLSPLVRSRFADALRNAVQEDLNQQLTAQHRLRVLPRTQDVQALGNAANVMELRLTISEEAYEMSLGVDEEGEAVEHFGPE